MDQPKISNKKISGNPEAVNDAYKLFTDTGYNKSKEDFVKLISTNPEALNDAHKLFTDTGYNKDVNAFSILLGLKKNETSSSQTVPTDSSSKVGFSAVAEKPKPIQPKNKNLQIADEAFSYAQKNLSKEKTMQRLNDEEDNNQFTDKVSQFFKDTYNRAIGVPLTALNTVAGGNKNFVAKKYISLESESKQSKKELEEEKKGDKSVVINDETIKERARTIFINKDRQEQMHQLIDEALPSGYDREGVWKDLKLNALRSNDVLRSKIASAEVYSSKLEEFNAYSESIDKNNPTPEQVKKFNLLLPQAKEAQKGLDYLKKNFDNFLKEAKSDEEKLELFKYSYNDFEKIPALLWNTTRGIVGGSIKLASESGRFVAENLNQEEMSPGFDIISKIGSDIINDGTKGNADFYRYKASQLNNWSDLGSFSTQLMAEQVPVFASMYLGGSGGLAMVSASSGGQKINELEESEKQPFTRRYSQGEKVAAGILYAGTEYAFEGLGTFRVFKDFGRTIASASSASRRITLNTATETTLKALGRSVVDGVRGSGTEYLTAESQIAIDEQLLGIVKTAKEKNEMRFESIVAGGTMDGGMTLVGGVIGFAISQSKLYSEKKDIAKVQSIFESMNNNTFEIQNNTMLDGSEIDSLYKENEKLNNEAFAIVSKNAKKGVNLSIQEKTFLVNTEQDQLELKRKAKEVSESNFSPEIKKERLKDLESQFNSLEQKRNSTLEGGYTALTELSDKKVIELKNRAQGELMFELNPDGTKSVTLKDEEISKKAVEIYNRENKDVSRTDEVNMRSTPENISGFTNIVGNDSDGFTIENDNRDLLQKDGYGAVETFKTREEAENRILNLSNQSQNNTTPTEEQPIETQPQAEVDEVKPTEDVISQPINLSVNPEVNTLAKEVEVLRAEEQVELREAIPDSDQYITDGKVDKAKLTNPEDKAKFDEIYDKYDKLITPKLQQNEKNNNEEPLLEGVRADRNEAEGGQTSTELRTEKDSEEEVKSKVKLTDKGKEYNVIFNKGRISITDNKGKEPSVQTRKKIEEKYAETFDFTKGDLAPRTEQAVDSKKYVADTSNNPVEVAQELLQIDNEQLLEDNISVKDRVIAEGIGKIKRKGFIRFGDKNSITFGIAKSYFNEQGGHIDVVAQEMTLSTGVEITEQDIIDFIIENPNGPKALFTKAKRDARFPLEQKFIELTGLPANNKYLNQAVQQQTAKDNFLNNFATSMSEATDEQLLEAALEIQTFKENTDGKEIDGSTENNVEASNSTESKNKPGVQEDGRGKNETKPAKEVKPKTVSERIKISNAKIDDIANAIKGIDKIFGIKIKVDDIEGYDKNSIDIVEVIASIVKQAVAAGVNIDEAIRKTIDHLEKNLDFNIDIKDIKERIKNNGLVILENVKKSNIALKSENIVGKLLSKSESNKLQNEIESNYATSPTELFVKDDIRKNIYNYENPFAEKIVNGIEVRIANGLIRTDKNGVRKKTWLIYADGKVAGEFNSANDAKKVVDFIERNLIKEVDTPKNSLELIDINKQLEKAKDNLRIAKEALERKAKSLDKELLKDNENLFGERKSQEANKLFDERVDENARNKATEKERQAIREAQDEIKKITERKDAIESGKANVTPGIEFDEKPTKSEATKLEEFKKILDGWDKDLKKFGDETLGMNIPVVVGKLAVKAMKLATVTAISVQEILEAGLKAVKDSDWYKNLSSAEQSDMNANFKDYINKPFASENKGEKTRFKIEEEVQKELDNGDSETKILDSRKDRMEKMIAKDYLERQKQYSNDEIKQKVEDSFIKSEAGVEDKKTTVEKIDKGFRAFMAKFFDRQFAAKFVLNKSGGRLVRNYLIASKGATGFAKQMYDEAYDKIYKGLTSKDIKVLDRIIQLRRFISIDETRAKENKPNVVHPDYINSGMAKSYLKILEAELGSEKFNKLNKSADNYFAEFKNLLKQMQEAGLISEQSYQQFFEIDYQPRKFLEFLTENEKDFAPTVSVKSTLSAEQIQKLEKGLDTGLVVDSRNLLSRAMNVRAKSIAMNKANVKLVEFIEKQRAVVKALKAKTNPTKKEKDTIKYFKELTDRVKNNPIKGFNEAGNPIYAFGLPKGFSNAYYYIDGVKNNIMMEDSFHDQYFDTLKGFFKNAEVKEKFTFYSMTGLVKSIATGNNPTFFITNTPRDFMFISTFSEEYGNNVLLNMAKLAKDAFLGINDIRKSNDNFKNYVKYGGMMNFLKDQGTLKNTGNIKKFFDKIDNTTKEKGVSAFNFITLNKLQTYSEVGFRMAVFSRSVKNQLKELGLKDINEVKDTIDSEGKKTYSKQNTIDDIYTNAVSSARGIMDFQQGGSITKDADAFIPYLNAATQGTRVMVDNFRERPLETTFRVFQTSAYLSSLGVMTSIALFAIADEDEEDKGKTATEKYLYALEGVSKYEKTNYFIVFTGKKDEKGQYEYYRVAKAQQLTPFISFTEGVIRKGMQKSIDYKKEDDTFENIMFSIEKNISPLEFGITDNITRNPVLKASLTYATGYDFYREQDLSYMKGKVPPAAEGFESKSVEDFYKSYGESMGISPARMKGAVEALITTPSTSPHIGFLYGGLDAMASDKDSKEILKDLGKDLLKSTVNRVKKQTSDFNRRLGNNKIIQKKIEKIEIDNAKTKRKFKDLTDGLIEKTITNAQVVEELKEIAKESPAEATRLAKMIRDRVKNKNISSSVFEIKYANSAEHRALLLVELFGDNLKDISKLSPPEKKLINQLMQMKAVNKEALFEYKKLINE